MRRSPLTASPTCLVIAPRCRQAPGRADTLTLDWHDSVSGDHGTLTEQSHHQAWLSLAERSQVTPGMLVLRADAVSHFHLAASRAIKRSEWPLLLEDLTLDDPHTLHLHMLERGRDHLELITLSSSELLAWQAWAQHQGIELAGWSVGFLALALPAEQTSATTLIDGEYRLFKGRGDPVTPGGTPSKQWLAWPHEWPTPPGWEELHWLDPTDPATDLQDPTTDLLEQTAEADTPTSQEASDALGSRAHSLRWYAHHLPPALSFHATGKQRSRPSSGLLASRPLRHFLVAAVVLVALNGVIALGAHYQESSLLAERNTDALAARFIGEPPPQREALDRLASRRQALHQLSARNQRLQALTQQVATRLENEDWQLSRLAVVNDQVTFSWRRSEPPAPVVISRARQQLLDLGEAQWSEATDELSLTLALNQPSPDAEPSAL